MEILRNMMGNPETMSSREKERLMRRFETSEERKLRFKNLSKQMGLTHGKGKRRKK